MGITEKRLTAGNLLTTVTGRGKTIPFYYESGVLARPLIKTVEDAIADGASAIIVKDVSLDLGEIESIRDWITGEVVYFNDAGERIHRVYTEETIKLMDIAELYESLVDMHDMVGNEIDDEDESNKDVLSLLELQFDIIWELGKRLKRRK